MTWTYTDESYKQYTRDTWNESAPAYDPVLRNLDGFNADLLRHAQPKPGERVLDVATGPGQPAISIAPLVGPAGRVVGVDLAERMVDLARRRAKEAAAENCEFHVMDAERLTFPDAGFDLVVCRFGLQIVTDPDQAIREIRRVLKPGGRLAATVWGPGEKTPAIHAIIGPMLENAEPDETGYLPTPYEMGGPGELVAILEKAGFRDAREERVTRAWTFESEDAYFESTLKGTPIGHSLSEEEPDVQKEVLRKARANLQRWKKADGSLALPAECVVVSART